MEQLRRKMMKMVVMINVVSIQHADDEDGEDDAAVRGESVVENVDQQLVQE